MGIKNKLLEIRLQKKFQFQKDFAEFLGQNHYQYNRWEKNEVQPNTEKLYEMAEKLDMWDLRELIYKTEKV